MRTTAHAQDRQTAEIGKKLPEGHKAVALGPASDMVPQDAGIRALREAREGLLQQVVVHLAAEISHEYVEVC